MEKFSKVNEWKNSQKFDQNVNQNFYQVIPQKCFEKRNREIFFFYKTCLQVKETCL